jgi:endoglucanase
MPAPATRLRAFLLGHYHSCCYFSLALVGVALYSKYKAMKPFEKLIAAALKIVAILCLVTVNSAVSNATINYDRAPIGITLNGAEFGEQNLPGIYKKDYIFPTEQEIKYFAGKGIELIQLPVRWERIQQKIGAGLDQNQMALINKFISTCKEYRVSVIITIQNYGRYKINNIPYTIGSKQVPYNQYRAFWKSFAANLKQHENIYGFNIMAEPYNMPEGVWENAAQEAIYGIREVDPLHTIIVDGNAYACAEKWVEYSDGLKYLEDSNNNLMYDAHCYFDTDCSGTYASGYNSDVTEKIGVQKVTPFINWLKKNNKRGYVGEFGVPKNDPRWIPVLDNFLSYIQSNGIGGCYWGAGPWWKGYSLSIEPLLGVDQPQMLVLNNYINQKNSYAKIN